MYIRLCMNETNNEKDNNVDKYNDKGGHFVFVVVCINKLTIKWSVHSIPKV